MCAVAPLMVAMGAGTALSAYSAYQQQAAANAAAKYQAQIYERNAQIAERQAQEIERVGHIAVGRHRLQVSMLQGTQRAGYAGAGVDVRAGTPMDVHYDTERMGDADALEMEYRSAMEAWAMRNQAANMLAQAALSRSSTASPWLGAAGVMLGGIGQMGGMYYGYRAATK